MAILVPDKMSFSGPSASGAEGAFMIEPILNSPYPSWILCRERMQYWFHLDHRGFWFIPKAGNLHLVIELMDWVEKTLGLSDNTKFYQENTAKNVVFVEPSRFWLDCEMKKNVMTLFLRVANCYANLITERTIFKAIQAYPYANLTLPALDRFFAGFTHYVGPPLIPNPGGNIIFMGWYSTFLNKDIAFTKTLLKLPGV